MKCAQTLYAMPLLRGKERGKNKEKNTTKQVLQNILRSRLPVSASSTIVCELKKKKLHSKQNNIHQLLFHQNEYQYTLLNTDNQQGPAAWHRELYSVFCNKL